MRPRPPRLAIALVVTSLGAASAGACGGDDGLTSSTSAATTTAGGPGGGGSSGSGGAPTGAGGAGGDTGITTTTGAGGAGGSQQQGFDVQPAAPQTVTVVAGQPAAGVTFTATKNGQPISVGWAIDKGDVGTIAKGPASTATFTPKGTWGGLVTVQAGYEGATVDRQVMVKVVAQQNGATAGQASQVAASVADLTKGGGVGGVGGEGLGGAVVDPATQNALSSPSAEPTLAITYPYDGTVWPRGLLAPLVQWEWAQGDADAVTMTLRTQSGSYEWQGSFARPAILAQTGGAFVRHPIPQDVWRAATESAGGADTITMTLVVARGGQAFGPVTRAWTVAPARLSGTIYYNSYGTQLAKNFDGALGGDGRFGGAVLSIRVGDTGPALVAGGDGGASQCRVCHSVAASGARLVVQRGDDYAASAAYDLTPNGAVEHAMGPGPAFPGISPDGALSLGSDGALRSLPGGAAAPTQGLPAAPIAMPAFAPSGTRVAFNPGLGPTLVTADFDPATKTFSKPVTVADFTGQPLVPGWPTFLPDSDGVVFEAETAVGADGHAEALLWTRSGAKGRLAWTRVSAPQPAMLDRLNGLENGNPVLPKLATPIGASCLADGNQVGGIDADHGDDASLAYEPTVSPLPAGGYAWVVFTSRRRYGSVTTLPPFCSDPRGVDLVKDVTPKKLWVAAIDMNGKPLDDPSHPPFYLPGQELVAGNSRGFWVLDPCRPEGGACDTGDQCCGGYCEPDAKGVLVCSHTPPDGHCSKESEKCASAADCCDPAAVCLNGFCAKKGPA